MISLSKPHESNLRSLGDKSCSFQLVALPSPVCLFHILWEFLGTAGNLDCTHLLIFHLKNVRLPLLALFLLMVSNVMKWFILKPVIFSETSFTYNGILGKQWSWVGTRLISTKFTLPDHMLHDEVEFKNLNEFASEMHPNIRDRAAKKNVCWAYNDDIFSMNCFPIYFCTGWMKYLF